MRARRGCGRALDIGTFSSPWTGLAAAVLLLAYLDDQQLDNRFSVTLDGFVVTREDLDRFFRSRWAMHLAICCGLTEDEIRGRGVLTWAG